MKVNTPEEVKAAIIEQLQAFIAHINAQPIGVAINMDQERKFKEVHLAPGLKDIEEVYTINLTLNWTEHKDSTFA